MTDPRTVEIARFSETPFGRTKAEGPESGEVFRESVLEPALAKPGLIHLVLDGVDGLPSSFWEEVMGGLVRKGWSVANLKERIVIETSSSELEVFVRLGWRHATEAERKRAH